MNGQEAMDDAELRALAAWEKQQRSRKRLAALVFTLVLVAGYVGAAIYGHGLAHA